MIQKKRLSLHSDGYSPRTLHGQGNFLDLLRFGVDPTLVGPTVVVAHFTYEKIPFLDVGPFHADPVVVYRPSVHVAD